jgi:hypothetical protein
MSSTSPPTFDFNVACTIGDIDPDNGSERDSVCGATVATSTAASSMGGVAATAAGAAVGLRMAVQTMTPMITASSTAMAALTGQPRAA